MQGSSRLLFASLCILLFGVPFGVALQTLCSTLAMILVILAWRKHWREFPHSLEAAERWSWVTVLAIVLLCMGATLGNAKNPEHEVWSYLIGFFPFFTLPLAFSQGHLGTVSTWRRLEAVLAIGVVVWGLVAWSQLHWGWKLEGSELIWGDRFRRSQAFYSHPLTLAYAALLLWPLSFAYALREPRNLRALAIAAGIGFLLYGSGSRTAQGVSAFIAGVLVLQQLRGRARWGMIGLGCVLVLGLLSTKNMVSDRFLHAQDPGVQDKETPYADDRIAFWLAHIEAIKERPLAGHGVHLGREYRLPYYAAIGLPEIKKAYEAHNQLLQLAFEGGVLAAGLFLVWLWLLHRSWSGLDLWGRRVRDAVLWAFLLGGLTQNAYFDSEVRYTFGVLMALAFVASRAKSTASLRS